MHNIDLDTFSRLTITPILTDEQRNSFGDYPSLLANRNSTTLADNLDGLHLSDVGTWATYLGKDLGVNPPDSLPEQWEHLRGTINADFIIVEMNWAGKASDDGTEIWVPYGGEYPVWHNFHTPPFTTDDESWVVAHGDEHINRGSNGVFRLARAVDGTPLQGAWVTDFWKGMATQSSIELNKALSTLNKEERTRLESGMISILRREAETLGARKPIWLVVGHDYDTAMRHAAELTDGEDWRIILIPHHSGQNQGKGSLKRWNYLSLLAMYESIQDACDRLGLPWNVDAEAQARFATMA